MWHYISWSMALFFNSKNWFPWAECVFLCAEPWGFGYRHLWVSFGVGEGRRTHGAHLLWICHAVWTVRPDACHRLLLQATGNTHTNIGSNLKYNENEIHRYCIHAQAHRDVCLQEIRKHINCAVHEHRQMQKHTHEHNCKHDRGHKHKQIHNIYRQISAKGASKARNTLSQTVKGWW